MSRRVLLVTFDALGARRGGSAVRALALAAALARAGHRPTLAAPLVHRDLEPQSFPVLPYDVSRPATLMTLVAAADVLVLPPDALLRVPRLLAVSRPIVFDLYDPGLPELLESAVDRPLGERVRAAHAHVATLNQVLRRGDFFVCASERQRDLWLGALVANGRVVPDARFDPAFRALVDVVPFGIDPRPPTPALDRARIAPGLRASDTLVVWGGGLWPWLDPAIVLRAMGRLAARADDIHLVVLAGRHPSGTMRSDAATTRELAVRLDLAGRTVHFVDEYVPYAERGGYLAAAAAAISTHADHLEARFAFRTRILDYLWAGLPVVCTAGDVLAEAIAREGLGLVVPPGNVEHLAHALERIARDERFVASCRERIASVRAAWTWDAAVAPLVQFLASPLPAPRPRARERLARLHGDAAAAWRVTVAEGPREALRRLHRHFFVRS